VGLTDTILFTCPACGHRAEFPRAQEGKAIYCPKCGSAQVVRGTDRFEKIPTGTIHRAEAQSGTGTFSSNGRIDFNCGSCGHGARIAASLAGQPVRCPTCGTVQLAGVGGLKVVRLDQNGKLPFTCTACSYAARLSPDYAGKAIRCPKCQAAQVVPRVLGEGAEPPRIGTGQIRRGTASIPKTPAGGIPAQMAMPTPLPVPGVATPPAMPVPAVTTTPLPQTPGPMPAVVPQATPVPRTPLPMPTMAGRFPTPPPQAFATPLPVAAAEMAPSAPAPSEPALPAPAPAADETPASPDLFDRDPVSASAPKPSVVRRRGQSGRLPSAPTEPTVEPARAIDPAHVESASSRIRRVRSAGWQLHAAIAAGVVMLLVLAACIFLWRSAAGELDAAKQQLNELRDTSVVVKEQNATQQAELTKLREELSAAQAAHKLVEADRDQLKAEVARLRTELEQAKAASETKPASPAPQP
jgi:DNA-directed RNA polymerase subunit RPC12/RpoP